MTTSIDGLLAKIRSVVAEPGWSYRPYHIELLSEAAEALATRTPAPSLGEDVADGLPDDEATSLRILTEAFGRAGRKLPFFGEAYEPGVVIRSIVRQVAALTAMRPVQEEPYRLDAQEHQILSDALRDSVTIRKPLARPVQEEGVGEVTWLRRILKRCEELTVLEEGNREEAIDALADIRGLVRTTLANGVPAFLAPHPDASPPSLGVEELRELSEKATPGEWSGDGRTDQDLPGIYSERGMWLLLADDDMREDRCNALFAAACVNHVREALSRVSDKSKEKPS